MLFITNVSTAVMVNIRVIYMITRILAQFII